MQNSLIGKMTKKIKQNLKAVKGTAKKTIALGLLLGMVATSTTGCFFNFNDPKYDREDDPIIITPDETEPSLGETSQDIEPETGDATETEKPLKPEVIPGMDTENSDPDLGNATETEEDIEIGKETGKVSDKETETETEKETEVEEKEDSIKDIERANAVIGELKSTINAELDAYFTSTKTTNSSKFTVSDIVYIETNDNGLNIGFTTKTSAGKEGYSVITVGSILDSANVKTLVGNLTNKDYLVNISLKDLLKLVDICKAAVKNSGISKNISSNYLIPITVDVSDLGNLVLAYYKTISPNGENCKQTADGYEYSANVLIQSVKGMKVETVSDISVARLGRNQYEELINNAIKDQLINATETESELGL